jgi:hypothetical protein
MLPYWALFSVFATGALLGSGRTIRGRASLLFLTALVVTVLMIGFRFKVGGDWGNYQGIYAHIGSIGLRAALSLANSDPGYSFLNWVGQALGLKIWFVNLVCATIFVWGMYKLAMQQPNPWIFMLAAAPYGLVVVGMGYTRQSVAIGLCAAALASFRLHRTKGAAVYVAISALFHKSSILMLPLIALADRHTRFVNIVLGGALAALLYYFLLGASSDRLFENYVGAALESKGAGVRLLMTVVPALLFLPLQRRFGFDETELPLWRILSYAALSSAIAVLLVPSSTAVDRVALYLIPFQAVIMSRLPWVVSRLPRDIAATSIIAAYSAAVLFVWLNFAVNAPAWLPYRMYSSL